LSDLGQLRLEGRDVAVDLVAHILADVERLTA
jgi:hypothetical protein